MPACTARSISRRPSIRNTPSWSRVRRSRSFSRALTSAFFGLLTCLMPPLYVPVVAGTSVTLAPVDNLMDPAGLAARTGDQDLRVIDARHDLVDPAAGRAAFMRGHIPGAVHLDLISDLSGTPGRHGGRHPLPDPAQLT